MIPWSSKIELEPGPISEGMVDRIANIDGPCESRMPEKEKVLGSLDYTGIKAVGRTEIRRTPAEQRIGRKRVVAAAGAELDIIDRATADTPSGIRVHRVSERDRITGAIV